VPCASGVVFGEQQVSILCIDARKCYDIGIAEIMKSKFFECCVISQRNFSRLGFRTVRNPVVKRS